MWALKKRVRRKRLKENIGRVLVGLVVLEVERTSAWAGTQTVRTRGSRNDLGLRVHQDVCQGATGAVQSLLLRISQHPKRGETGAGRRGSPRVDLLQGLEHDG